MGVLERLRPCASDEGREHGTFLARLRFLLSTNKKIVLPPALLHPDRIDHELWSKDRILYTPGVYKLPPGAVFVGCLELEDAPACVYNLRAEATLLLLVRNAPLGRLEGKLWDSKQQDAFSTKYDVWHPASARDNVFNIPGFILGFLPIYHLVREGPAAFLHLREPREEASGWFLVEPAAFPKRRLQLRAVFQAGVVAEPPPDSRLMSPEDARRKVSQTCSYVANLLSELAVDLPPEGPSPALGPTPCVPPPAPTVAATSRPGLMLLSQLVDGEVTQYGSGVSLADPSRAARTMLASLGIVVVEQLTRGSFENILESHQGSFGDRTLVVISLATGGGAIAEIRMIDAVCKVSLDVDSAHRVVRCAGVTCIVVDDKETFCSRVLQIGAKSFMPARDSRIDLEAIAATLEAAVAGAAAAAVERALVRFREENQPPADSKAILDRIAKLRAGPPESGRQ